MAIPENRATLADSPHPYYNTIRHAEMDRATRTPSNADSDDFCAGVGMAINESGTMGPRKSKIKRCDLTIAEIACEYMYDCLILAEGFDLSGPIKYKYPVILENRTQRCRDMYIKKKIEISKIQKPDPTRPKISQGLPKIPLKENKCSRFRCLYNAKPCSRNVYFRPANAPDQKPPFVIPSGRSCRPIY